MFIPESDTATEINLLIMDKLINVFFFMRSYFTIFTQGEDLGGISGLLCSHGR